MGYNVAVDGPAGAGEKYDREAGGKGKGIYLCGYRRNVPWARDPFSEKRDRS